MPRDPVDVVAGGMAVFAGACCLWAQILTAPKRGPWAELPGSIRFAMFFLGCCLIFRGFDLVLIGYHRQADRDVDPLAAACYFWASVYFATLLWRIFSHPHSERAWKTMKRTADRDTRKQRRHP